MAKKQQKEDRVFRVSLTTKDRDIKEFKETYQGNWSSFVREALREKIQREHLMTRTQKRPGLVEKAAPETKKQNTPKKAGEVKMPPLPSKTVLTEEEIRNGLLSQKEDSEGFF